MTKQTHIPLHMHGETSFKLCPLIFLSSVHNGWNHITVIWTVPIYLLGE